MNITLYTSQDGHVTFRTVGDPSPCLRVTCPLGEDGDTCGMAVVTDLGDPASIAQVANSAVKTLQESGCHLHGDVPVAVTGSALDAALAATPAAVLQAAVATAFQVADTTTTVNGVLVYTGHVEAGVTLIWVLIVGTFAALFTVAETWAFRDDEENTTLSAQWWKVRTRRWVAIVGFAAFAWLGHHFFNPLDTRGGGLDDYLVIAGAALLATQFRYKPRNGL